MLSWIIHGIYGSNDNCYAIHGNDETEGERESVSNEWCAKQSQRKRKRTFYVRVEGEFFQST